MMRNALQRMYGFSRALMLIVLALVLINIENVSALQLGTRYIRIGTSRASAVNLHTLSLTTLATSTIGSIEFEYCINDAFVGSPCVAPTGLNVASAAIGSQLGLNGFSIHGSTTANRLVLTRAPSLVNAGTFTYQINNITNPSTEDQSVYVRISTYATTDASGLFDNEGGVVFTIQDGIGAQIVVPPFLTFCSGVSVAGDCSSVNGAYVGLGEFSTSTARVGQSQFAGATNDPTGYFVSINGVTMTSGNNIIPSLNSPTNSIPGTSQFGINLRANNNPSGGQNPQGLGTLTPTPSYNIPNQFKFIPGELIAQSNLPTRFNTMTVTYMVNISSNQNPGVYSTTLTYIAVAAF